MSVLATVRCFHLLLAESGSACHKVASAVPTIGVYGDCVGVCRVERCAVSHGCDVDTFAFGLRNVDSVFDACGGVEVVCRIA